MGIFLLIVPSMVIGTQFNGECLGMWFHRMIDALCRRGGDQLAGSQPVVPRVYRMLIELDAVKSRT